MAELESTPSVINFDALLAAISEDAPSGEYLRYSGIYDEIAEARRADLDVPQGDWQTEVKVADHRKVISLAVPALETKTKDLQIAVWLGEALVKIHGAVGLRDALRLVAGLQEIFWDTLHPEIDEGDMEGRANAVAWLEQQLAFAIRFVPLTGYSGYGLNDYDDAKKYDFPETVDSYDDAEVERINNLRAEAEQGNKVTANKWRAELAATSRSSVEATNFLFEECWAAYNELNQVIESKFDRNQAPATSNLRKAMDDAHTLVKRILDEKRAEEPDAVDDLPVDAGSTDGENVRATGVATASGAIQTRADALKRLSDIADYFRKNEPHSPISYILTRAVKWGNMPLEHWLQDVIKDETVIYQLRQTLGLNTGLPSDE